MHLWRRLASRNAASGFNIAWEMSRDLSRLVNKQDWRLFKRLKYGLKGHNLVAIVAYLCKGYGNLDPETVEFQEGKLRI